MDYKPIVNNLNSFYSVYKNPKYKIDDWIIVNNEAYIKNKGKITIIGGEFGLKDHISYNEYDEKLITKQATLLAESKNEYVCIKYNNNFIAVNISDTEYGLTINDFTLVAVANSEVIGLNKNMPKLKEILKILGWKISQKGYANLLEQINFN
jgi:uncharacterized protein YdaL